MDEAKTRLLFGPTPVAGLDPDDPDDRATLLEEGADRDLSPAQLAARELLANQIIDEEPPEVWVTAQRLLGLELDRDTVLGQLSLALATVMQRALAADAEPDPSDYSAALDRLPVPTADEMEAALVAVVRERQGVGAEEADHAVLAALGREDDDDLVRHLLERVGDRLVDDDGPLAWLCGDRTVHVADLTAGIVLTHRLSLSEHELGALTVAFDLVGFARRDVLRLDNGEELTPVSAEPGHVAWTGPDAWLDGYPVESLLAVRVSPDGLVTLDPLADVPALDSTFIDRVRKVYDAEVDEPGMPVTAEDLVLGLLLEDRSTFATPRPPLSEVCAAAGLEQRGHEVAHDEEIWANERRLGRIVQVLDLLDSRGEQEAALAALAAADEGDNDPDRLRTVLRGLRDPEVLDVVTDLLFGLDDDPELVEQSRGFSEGLLEAAKRPTDVAVARWFAAVVAERSGEARVAEAHLHLAEEADPQWFPAVDRLAWYASDRGDAQAAVRLWRRLGIERSINQDLDVVEPFSRSTTPKLGRNEPCWCGSGRKYKQCHLGHTAPVALPDRVGWLCRKAAAYLERHGGSAGADVMDFAMTRAIDPGDPDSVAEALFDPLVIDVALLEGGWFERFLAERGPLLPEDEALLAAAWTLVPRTLYEVIDVRPGRGLTLHDLGAGDDIDVRERSFSRQAKVGQVICGRAVPDGETHQLIGGVFPVVPGTETEVLRMCDERLGYELCDYAARPHRPPTLQTREGEPLIVCEGVIDLRDPLSARPILDRHYEREGEDTWIELHRLDQDERILRAQLRLDGARLSVTTHSEPRMDRVLDTLRADIPDLVVIRDKRKPLRPGELPSAPPTLAPMPPGLDTPEVIEQIQDMQERRWLREHVPALGGLTPLEAAADPSRVEQLQRLLASFPDTPSAGGVVMMRPDRIRELLGLPETTN